MNDWHDFHRLMATQSEIALATSRSDTPNVRIVNFCYLPENPGVLWFATFKDNTKVAEFEANSRVAFTTVPYGSTEHVRASRAEVRKSALSLSEMQDAFIEKIPSYRDIIAVAGDELVLYEIHFSQADVILDAQRMGKVEWTDTQ
ncbi:Pyridoxamine 5'-phosphate oxidase [Leminorella richardii]|uniref:Pyridoxamine 5'-phosphate oxidase n=1 Tax=Leminorella richardii TaxID=158841 RepID=A0A2X4UYN0_9GAMM|nr:pyridoxamine 5'-phosphate oxidase family protein [Leminorella richardii]SQI40918.1 Pyridoxamine 5'-phosphate oxidase [Leminorella richardii]